MDLVLFVSEEFAHNFECASSHIGHSFSEDGKVSADMSEREQALGIGTFVWPSLFCGISGMLTDRRPLSL